MKKIIILSAILVVQLHVNATVDTIRHYNSASAKLGYYFMSATYPTQYACFQPSAPGNIQSVIITLGGAKGTVTMHLYGHEGGDAFPQLQNGLTDSIVVNKTIIGVQKITVKLPLPVRINKNLFFIKLNHFSSNVQLITDTTTSATFCSSPSGGDYHRQYIFMEKQGGYYGDANYVIDVVMDYFDGTTSPQYLKDITADAGINTGLGNSSVSWGDINDDHHQDLFVAGKLYKNSGNGTFTDITAAAGINTPAHTTTFIDMNNDGKDDILFLHSDSTYNAIYINNGNETFTKQPLKLTTPDFIGGIQALAVADYNNDGYPDIFVGQVWAGTTLKDSAQTYIEQYLPHYLYLNDKNLGFIDKTSLILPTPINDYALVMQFGGEADADSVKKYGHLIGTNRCVRGAQWVDYNDDGHMDLYVANYRLQPDELWKNNGDGTFTDVAKTKGIDMNGNGYSGHGTGVDWADYDNDGDMDLLLPQLAHPRYIQYDHRPTTIYQNSGTPFYDFTDLNPGVNAGTLGIEYEETHAGANWGDLNNDGLPDFAICAFYGCRFSDIYIQKPDHTFEMKSFAFGISSVSSDADMTLVDYNNDGKLDYAGGSNAGKFTLFKNQSEFQRNYVELILTDTSGNKAAIGAKVTVYAGGEKHTAYQMPYHGAKMSKGNRMHFGLGTAMKIDSVIVRWPNGTTNSEKFTGVAINNLNSLYKGGIVKADTFQTQIWDVADVKEDNGFVSGMTVYPNPASFTVTFDYELTTSTAVSLEIYSVLGQKIILLNNEIQNAGKHAVQWNVKGYVASGIYSYRMQTGEFQKTGLVIVN